MPILLHIYIEILSCSVDLGTYQGPLYGLGSFSGKREACEITGTEIIILAVANWCQVKNNQLPNASFLALAILFQLLLFSCYGMALASYIIRT